MPDLSFDTIQHAELLKIWVARYMPNLASIPSYMRPIVVKRLSEALIVLNRQAMADSALKNLAIDCTLAGIEAQKICLAVGEGLDSAEAKAISNQITTIYEQLLQLYVQEFVFAPTIDYLYELDTAEGQIRAAARILPGFEQLNQAIEPLLRQLQMIYLNSSNRRAIGFLTTQLHLTRQNVLSRLNIYDKMWLGSYFKLVEELVCMPWQRICKAALCSSASSLALAMVQEMLPKSQAIALSIYQKAMLEFPTHASRQGRIQAQGVQASSLRDLSMFQAYIWLCVLEGNVSVVAGELLPLCLIVFPAVNVKWTLVECGVLWIIQEIQTYLNPEQNELFTPYAQQIQQLFVAANPAMVDEVAIHQAMRYQF
jgi:hypothetical protein